VRVLVVDDSAAVRARIVGLLREAGLDVVGEADTAARGLALARSLRPDAVVLDLELPDGCGLQILPALKTQVTVVAVLTNAAHARTRSLALGADHFFDKSIEFDSVARALVG
jgi:DNA-binding NarL/FixJ family response regulator